MPQRNLHRAFLLAALVLATSALHAQAPAPDSGIATFASSITLANGVTFPALPEQITPNGQLSFTAPFIQGQARAGLAGVVHMKLPRSRDEKGAYCLRLVNGDRIVGDLVELDEDVVVLDAAMLGELEIPRDIVHSIALRGKSPVFIDTDFALDGFDIWKATSGQWIETNKGLCIKTLSTAAALLCEAPHDGPITLVVEMDASMNPKASQEMMYAYRMTFSFYRDSLKPSWRSDTLDVVVSSLRTHATLHTNMKRFPAHGGRWPEGKGELRIAYDPATFTIQTWVDGKRIMNNTLNGGPTKGGRYVRILTSQLVDLRSVRMYRGIFPPGEGSAAPAEDTDILLLANGDRLAASEVRIEDEHVIAQGADGTVFKLDQDKVAYIALRLKGRRALPHRKEDVRVRLQETSVQLKLDRLTAEVLTGSSAGLGKLSISRAGVATIESDMHGRKRAAAKSRIGNGAVVTLGNGIVLPATVGTADNELAIITAPWLIGAARLKMSEVARMNMLHLGRSETGKEMLFLTDGSRIFGSLRSISADTFELHSKLMGGFKPPRKFVQSVSANQDAGLLDATDFTAGTLGKWRTVGGQWELRRGGLLSVHNSGGRCIALELPHDGPITAEVVMHRAPPRKPNIFAWLAVCAAKPTIHQGESWQYVTYEGIVFNFGATNMSVASLPHPNPKKPPPTIHMRNANPDIRPFIFLDGGTLTIAWDPATKKATAWGDGRFLATAVVDNARKRGNYILFGAVHNALVFDSVRVWKGIAAAGTDDEPAIADRDVAVDNKGKATGGDRITMTDGKVRIATDAGELTCPMAELGSILTARDSRAIIARKPEHVRVGLARSVILLRLKGMDAQFLEGVSPTLGAMRIPRDAVRWIEVKAPVPPPKKKPRTGGGFLGPLLD